ncbi:hypothetical protein Vi05172_g4575 [Venturia inaequalis]|nr:hypothetical protein Vi05172_g4575 [Venturia inaequalis]
MFFNTKSILIALCATLMVTNAQTISCYGSYNSCKTQCRSNRPCSLNIDVYCC